MERLIVGYFIVINLLGFFAMGLDKRKAIRREYRIPEKTLFLLAILGGSLGVWGGMYSFRHKTKHWYFVVGLPLIVIGQAVLIFIL